MSFPLPAFSIARLPRIEFGPGTIAHVPELAAANGTHALILTGHKSFTDTQSWADLQKEFKRLDVTITHMKRSAGEPTPEQVDEKVAELAGEKIDVVIGIGGGSVLDEAKAIAGLLGTGHSAMDYLEGVGPELEYKGPATPFIAVPTTAGTGSEATKNAVLSRHDEDGFKKSFRDEQLVAQWAVVDPDLLASCPPEVIAGNGMDAFTQLLESYVSTKANPMTDALALQGLMAVREGLARLYESRGEDADARYHMALASLLSGINLAQTGLGSVHGLASPLGAFFPIPHGVVCGTLVGAATKVNIAALTERPDKNSPALAKYVKVGQLMMDDPGLAKFSALIVLEEVIDDWTIGLELPRLASFGVTRKDFPRLIKNISPSSMKTNPIVLTDTEAEHILQMRL
ncbi:MAG: iron-containing alcohol dehydrogenase [Hyphomicrobiaceae bacterium]|nr:iron-containing alcohol dehydrogenase [Hyphomicrobiaceae bacterium]